MAVLWHDAAALESHQGSCMACGGALNSCEPLMLAARLPWRLSSEPVPRHLRGGRRRRCLVRGGADGAAAAVGGGRAQWLQQYAWLWVRTGVSPGGPHVAAVTMQWEARAWCDRYDDGVWTLWCTC